MKKIGFLLFCFFCLFTSPAAAYEAIALNDSSGLDTYIVGNPYTQDLLLPSKDLPGSMLPPQGPDYIIYEETKFFTAQDDVISEVKINFKVVPSSDKVTHSMPVTFEGANSSSPKTFFINTKWDDSLVFQKYIVTILDENSNVLLSHDSFISGLSNYGTVVFKDNRILIQGFHSNLLNMIGSEATNVSELTPASAVSFEGYDYPEAWISGITVKDNFEDTKNYDSMPMRVYWLITRIFPDNNNTIYPFFKVGDMIFTLVTGLIMLFVAAPFFYIFFAMVCGLTACILKGSFRTGIPAGIHAFVAVMKIPYLCVKGLWEVVMRAIEILKPI